jgi:glyoxylase-like metal-dependent hydrolase (beta-lactamase superfamily II)/8-oxo-dGTP pyrophosphatase MutT (NUDIX family)
VSDIIPAAAVLLARGPGSPDLFVVRRSERLRFLGGFWAFPGGRVDPGDAAVLFAPGGPSADRPIRRAAATRELFEETGVLLARRADGSFLPAAPEVELLRRDLNDGQVSFADVLRRLQLTLHADDFRLLGDITTPPFVPTRFDTTFFVAHLPPGQDAEVWPGELDQGGFGSADDLLAWWRQGGCLVSPPTVMTLEAIRGRAVDEAPARLGPLLASLAAGQVHPIYFSPEVQLIPLHTQALPPSSYTNAYLVGRDPAYLIDPGAFEPDEQQRLFGVLDGRIREGLRLAAVVLTHQHRDHVSAAAPCAERYRVPVWAHARTAEALRGRVNVTRLLGEGDRLELGVCPAGDDWHLEALHTPGHTAGHLAFWEPRYRLLFTGDLVSTLSSVVIAPPEGDLIAYLASLRRLETYNCRLLLPGHGGASSTPRVTLQEALTHRAKREQQLLVALGPTPRTVAEMVPQLYRGVPAPLMRVAEQQMLAGLLKLQREGRVEAVGEGPEAGWRLRPTP